MAEKLAPEKRHSFVNGGEASIVSSEYLCTCSGFSIDSECLSHPVLIFDPLDQKVFEWDQTLDEVNMYIDLPPNLPKKVFYCKIHSERIEVGIKGNPPYLNHDLACPVKTDSSFWTLEDEVMHVTLQKRDKGKTWSSPILGQGLLDPYAADLEQKRLMLQRFQEENPGFDFSQAQFSGTCPDPRTFMGGIS